MLNLLPKGAQTKLLTFFCLKIFSICHWCRWHRWCTLSREYLCEFLKKFEMAAMVYSDAWGKLIHEKNQKSKISWHCPFKGAQAWPSWVWVFLHKADPYYGLVTWGLAKKIIFIFIWGRYAPFCIFSECWAYAKNYLTHNQCALNIF
jgi:hypothetical protein